MRSRSSIVLILFVTLLPLFLGHDFEIWVQGAILVSMGMVFLLYPPKHSMKRGIGLLCFALFALGFASFLPASWFGIPRWRQEVIRELGIDLPNSLSPQPWVTLDCLILLGAGLLWIYYLAARTWTRGERVFAMHGLGWAVFLFTLASLAGYLVRWTPPLWEGQNFFGPIANRNQMAIVLCLGSLILLACAEYAFRGHHWRRALFWASGIPLIFGGLVINGSRAGVLFFFAGLGLWVAVSAFRKRSSGGAQAGIAGSFLLLAAAVFFLFGGKTLDRFELQGESLASEVKAEARYQVFSETINLIKIAPVFGIGLGNFAPVFSLNRYPDPTGLRARVSQPDNDWLWLTAEMGLVGLGLTLAIIALLIKRAFPFRARHRGDRRVISLRVIALICVAIFCLDGLVNIPGHLLAVVPLGLLLLALSLHTNRRAHSSRLLKLIYPACGLALVAIGSIWITATVKDYPLPGRIGVGLLDEQAFAAHLEGDHDTALKLIDRVIQLEPLRYRHYSKRATYVAEAGLPLDKVEEDFRIARRLEPTHPILPLGEVEFWLGIRPINAIGPLREAMARAPDLAGHYYRLFAERAALDPLFAKALGELAFEDPEYQLTYLFLAPVDEKLSQISRVLESDPNLSEWLPDHKRQLFVIWYRAGDNERLAELISSRQNWKDVGWPMLFRHYGSTGDHLAALDLAAAHLQPPALPRFTESLPLESLRTSFLSNPADVTLGLRLYTLEAELRNTERALDTLRTVAKDPACPDYVFYLLAEAYKESGQFQIAWDSLQTYLTRKGLL